MTKENMMNSFQYTTNFNEFQRELTPEEVEIVNGGAGVPGFVGGAILGGYGTYVATGSVGAAVGGALLGGVGGFFGSIAGAQAGTSAAIWTANSVGLGVIAIHATSGPPTKPKAPPPPPPPPPQSEDAD